MAIGDGRWNDLPREVREVLREYLDELTKALGSNLESVTLYGSGARGEFLPGRSNVNLLLVLKGADHESLGTYAEIHRRWRKEGIVVPLFLTERELQSWGRDFPLEFLDIIRHHLVLHGRDPFQNVEPDTRQLPAQCLQEIRGNVLRARQRFVEGGGKPDTIEVLLPLSVTALAPCLRGLLVALDRPAAQSVSTLEDVLADLGASLKMDTGPLAEAWRLKLGAITPGRLELPRLFERYLTALEQLGDKAAERLT